MRISTMLSAAGVAAAVVFGAGEASAMLDKTLAGFQIAGRWEPWMGAAAPNTVYPGVSGCAPTQCSGWYMKFANSARIYAWNDGSGSGTRPVGGAILAAHNWFGAAGSFLGYPTTDEVDTANTSGRKQGFQGGSLYYKWGTPAAYEVHGWIKTRWSTLGEVQSVLGFPISGEIIDGAERYNKFEHGEVRWSGVAGSWQVDTWPVMTSVSETPTQRPSWLTARAVSVTAKTFELFGCGFTPGATVTLRVNSRAQRVGVGTVVAEANGCFAKQTGTIPTNLKVENILTFEATQGSPANRFAVVGVPYPEAAMAQIESDFGVSWGDTSVVVHISDAALNFGTPTDCGDGVYMPISAVVGPEPRWFHVAVMQELVNQYTGKIAGYWPRDWWADHKSPFPTFVNWRVLGRVGSFKRV